MGKKRTIIQQLRKEDINALRALYYYRALDVEQLMTLVYQVDTNTIGGKRVKTLAVKRLLSFGLVMMTKDYQPDHDALQITNKGIGIVKDTTDLQEEIVTDNGDIRRGYYTAAQLQMKAQFINHQVHTNAFAFAFARKANGLPWQYFDEKFVSQFNGMRPDGLLRVAGIDFFIENDMGTESKRQLDEKWTHYREFFKSHAFFNKENPIKVMFILNGHNSQNGRILRKNLVKKSLLDTFSDAITGDFDVMVGSQAELIDLIFKEIIPAQLGKNRRIEIIWDLFRKRFKYQLSFGSAFSTMLMGDSYDYYLRRTKNHRLISQEYFIDDYTTGNLQVLHRIMWWRKNQKLFANRFRRRIKLIVIVNSVEDFYADLKMIGHTACQEDDMYIVTQSSLIKAKFLYQSLMQIYDDTLMIIKSPDLRHRIGIKNLETNRVAHKSGRIDL